MALEGKLIGHYHLIRLIGKGSMGEVYLAQDTRIARNVAIKVVRIEAAPYPHGEATTDVVRLFEREMKVITALDHPNILPLYDFGEEKDNQTVLTYMVMPYRSEGSLADWMQSHYGTDTLSPQQVIFLIDQAASALQHAHSHQLVHLDVKPANFLIRQREDMPDRPDLLLADFGISKFSSATATASQSIRGTPAYMAPELWVGRPVFATDQYALAIMAYQLLIGHSPFRGTMHQIMYQHLEELPKPPSALDTRIPQAVDTVLLRGLAKKPEDRFPSISSFARAFMQAWQHEETPVPSQQEALPPTETVYHKESVLPPTVYLSSEPLKSSQKKSRNLLLPVLICLLLLLVIGATIGVVNALHGAATSSKNANPIHTSTNTSTATTPTTTTTIIQPTPPVAPIVYPQLKPFYSGTASGYANATITFTRDSQDGQGNITMETTFQRTDNPQKFAKYACQGTVSKNYSLHLSCRNQNFLVGIDGNIYPDGHMEGTWLTTDTNDPAYHHSYNWSVS